MPLNQEIEEGLRKGKREREGRHDEYRNGQKVGGGGLQVTRVTQYLSLKILKEKDVPLCTL